MTQAHVSMGTPPSSPELAADVDRGIARRGTVGEAVLYAFDLLELDGEDLRDMPLRSTPLW
jgi:ATP-dependent DNA ligase